MTTKSKSGRGASALSMRTAESGNGRVPGAAIGLIVKLDRLQLYCHRNPTAALMAISGFKSLAGHRINRPADGRFQAFSWVHWFVSETSAMKFLLESQRREAWLPPYRLTLYADDKTGLLPDEVFSVLEVLTDFKLTLLELAFDFGPGRNHAQVRPRTSALWEKSSGTECERNRLLRHAERKQEGSDL
jgi:hypothetical protein